jgi:hypothetical protein
MATRADIDALADKLTTNGPLLWVVADCPVVALFKNNETLDLDTLGQPLDRNGCGDLLRLWVGLNEDTRELFVALTIRIRVSTVRKKTRRQGRLMYLVLPSTSLHLSSSVIGYTDLVEKLSQRLFDVPSDTQSAKCELLHMSIDLGTHISDVIMPEYQCRSNVMPQAMTLLRKLRSLSEASSFQLYTNQEVSRQEAVQHVSNILLDGASMITPSVDLKGFYPGGRSACKNMWLEQGWLEAGDKNIPRKENPVEENRTDLKPILEPQPPPPYKPSIVPHRAPMSPASDLVLSLPSIEAPVSQQGLSDLPAIALPKDSTPARSASHHHYQQFFIDRPESAPIETKQSSALARHPSPSTPEASLSSGYTATFLSGFPTQSPLRKFRESLAAQIRAVPNKSSGLSVQVAASSVDDHVLQDDDRSTRANTPSDHLSHVPDSVTRKRLPSYSLEEDASSISKRQALAQQSPQLPLVNNLQADLSPTIPDTVSCQGENQAHALMRATSPLKQEYQLSQWLVQAWRYCPTAHYLFILQLLRYGAALSGDCSQDEIAACHVQCTLILLAHCTKATLAEESNRSSTEHAIDDQLRALVRWLYVLRPGADIELFPSLLSLSSLDLILISRAGRDHDSVVADFQQQKAKVVSQACIRYGAELLQDETSDLVSAMAREGSQI